jgi:hypothetical protein
MFLDLMCLVEWAKMYLISELVYYEDRAYSGERANLLIIVNKDAH